MTHGHMRLLSLNVQTLPYGQVFKTSCGGDRGHRGVANHQGGQGGLAAMTGRVHAGSGVYGAGHQVSDLGHAGNCRVDGTVGGCGRAGCGWMPDLGPTVTLPQMTRS